MTTRPRFMVLVAGSATARLPITVSVIPAGHPDAELLEACARFDKLQHAYGATDFQARPGTSEEAGAEAERQRLIKLQTLLMDRMAELQAVTWAGQVARARSLVLWAPDLMREPSGDTVEGLTRAVLRDLVAVEMEAFRLETV